MRKLSLILFRPLVVVLFLAASNIAFSQQTTEPDKAKTIVAKAVQLLGGDRYLQIRTQVG